MSRYDASDLTASTWVVMMSLTRACIVITLRP